MAKKTVEVLKKNENPAAFTDNAAKQEQAAQSTAITLFRSGGAIDLTKFKRRNMPQMVKPGDVPLGASITGKIIDVVDSPVSTVKGKLLWIQNPDGIEFTFPVTGTIRQALAPGKAEGDELEKTLRAEIGNLIVATRLPSKESAKFKKEMFMFDVFTAKP